MADTIGEALIDVLPNAEGFADALLEVGVDATESTVEAMNEGFQEQVEFLEELYDDFSEDHIELWEQTGEAVAEVIEDSFEAVEDSLDSLTGAAEDSAEGIADAFDDVVDDLAGAFDDAVIDSTGAFRDLEQSGDSLSRTLSRQFDGIGEDLSDAFTSASTDVDRSLREVSRTVESTVRSIDSSFDQLDLDFEVDVDLSAFDDMAAAADDAASDTQSAFDDGFDIDVDADFDSLIASADDAADEVESAFDDIDVDIDLDFDDVDLDLTVFDDLSTAAEEAASDANDALASISTDSLDDLAGDVDQIGAAFTGVDADASLAMGGIASAEGVASGALATLGIVGATSFGVVRSAAGRTSDQLEDVGDVADRIGEGFTSLGEGMGEFGQMIGQAVEEVSKGLGESFDRPAESLIQKFIDLGDAGVTNLHRIAGSGAASEVASALIATMVGAFTEVTESARHELGELSDALRDSLEAGDVEGALEHISQSTDSTFSTMATTVQATAATMNDEMSRMFEVGGEAAEPTAEKVKAAFFRMSNSVQVALTDMATNIRTELEASGGDASQAYDAVGEQLRSTVEGVAAAFAQSAPAIDDAIIDIKTNIEGLPTATADSTEAAEGLQNAWVELQQMLQSASESLDIGLDRAAINNTLHDIEEDFSAFIEDVEFALDDLGESMQTAVQVGELAEEDTGRAANAFVTLSDEVETSAKRIDEGLEEAFAALEAGDALDSGSEMITEAITKIEEGLDGLAMAGTSVLGDGFQASVDTVVEQLHRIAGSGAASEVAAALIATMTGAFGEVTHVADQELGALARLLQASMDDFDPLGDVDIDGSVESMTQTVKDALDDLADDVSETAEEMSGDMQEAFDEAGVAADPMTERVLATFDRMVDSIDLAIQQLGPMVLDELQDVDEDLVDTAANLSEAFSEAAEGIGASFEQASPGIDRAIIDIRESIGGLPTEVIDVSQAAEQLEQTWGSTQDTLVAGFNDLENALDRAAVNQSMEDMAEDVDSNVEDIQVELNALRAALTESMALGEFDTETVERALTTYDEMAREAARGVQELDHGIQAVQSTVSAGVEFDMQDPSPMMLEAMETVEQGIIRFEGAALGPMGQAFQATVDEIITQLRRVAGNSGQAPDTAELMRDAFDEAFARSAEAARSFSDEAVAVLQQMNELEIADPSEEFSLEGLIEEAQRGSEALSDFEELSLRMKDIFGGAFDSEGVEQFGAAIFAALEPIEQLGPNIEQLGTDLGVPFDTARTEAVEAMAELRETVVAELFNMSNHAIESMDDLSSPVVAFELAMQDALQSLRDHMFEVSNEIADVFDFASEVDPAAFDEFLSSLNQMEGLAAQIDSAFTEAIDSITAGLRGNLVDAFEGTEASALNAALALEGRMVEAFQAINEGASTLEVRGQMAEQFDAAARDIVTSMELIRTTVIGQLEEVGLGAGEAREAFEQNFGQIELIVGQSLADISTVAQTGLDDVVNGVLRVGDAAEQTVEMSDAAQAALSEAFTHVPDIVGTVVDAVVADLHRIAGSGAASEVAEALVSTMRAGFEDLGSMSRETLDEMRDILLEALSGGDIEGALSNLQSLSGGTFQVMADDLSMAFGGVREEIEEEFDEVGLAGSRSAELTEAAWERFADGAGAALQNFSSQAQADLSGFGVDAEMAAAQIGVAWEDSSNELTASFEQLGPFFTRMTDEIIADLHRVAGSGEAPIVAAALVAAFEEASSEVGTSVSGAMLEVLDSLEMVDEAVEDGVFTQLAEGVDQSFDEAVDAVDGHLGTLEDRLAEALAEAGPLADDANDDMANAFASGSSDIRSSMQDLRVAARQSLEAAAAGSDDAADNMASAFASATRDIDRSLNRIRDSARDAASGVSDGFDDAWDEAVRISEAGANGFLETVQDATESSIESLGGVGEAFEDLGGDATEAGDSVRDALGDGVDDARDQAVGALDDIRDSVGGVADDAVGVGSDIADGITAGLDDAANAAASAGEDIGEGIADGLGTAADASSDAAEQIASDMGGAGDEVRTTFEGLGDFVKDNWQAVIGASAAAGAAAEGFARSQMDTNQVLARSAMIIDEDEEAIRSMIVGMTDWTFAGEDAVGAMEQLIRRGVDTREEFETILPALDDFADATGRDMVGSTSELNDVLKSLGIPMDEIGGELDALTRLATESDVEFSQLTRQLPQVAEELQDLDADTGFINAALEVFADRGLNGRQSLRDFTSVLGDSEGDMNSFLEEMGLTNEEWEEYLEQTGAAEGLTEEMAGRMNDMNTPAQRLQGVMGNLAFRFGGLAEAAGLIAAPLAAAGPALLGITQGSQILSKVAPGLAKGLGAITKAFAVMGKALLANPLFLLAAAIVAIIAVVWHFRDEIMEALGQAWEWISDVFGNLVGWFSDVWDRVVELVPEAFGTMIDWLSDLPGRILEALAGLATSVLEFLQRWHPLAILWRLLTGDEDSDGDESSVLDWLRELPGRLIDSLVGMATSLLEFLQRWHPLAILWRLLTGDEDSEGDEDGILSWLTDLPGKIVEALAGLATTVFDFLTEWHPLAILWRLTIGRIDDLEGTLSDMVDNILGFFSGMADGVSGFVSGMWGGVTGAFDSARSGVTRTAGRISDGVTGALSGMAGPVGRAVSSVTDEVRGRFDDMRDNAVDRVTDLRDGVTDAFSRVGDGLSEGMGDISTALDGGFEGVRDLATERLEQLRDVAEGVFDRIDDIAGGRLSDVASSVRTHLGDARDTARNRLNDIRDRFREGWNRIDDLTSGRLSDLVDGIRRAGIDMASRAGRAMANLWGRFLSGWQRIIRGFREKSREAVDFIRGLPRRFLDALGNLRDLLSEAGRDLMRGLRDGISEMASAPVRAVTDAARSVISSARGMFRVDSPSRVFMDLGEDLIEGLRIGLESEVDSATDVLAQLSDQLQAVQFDPDLTVEVSGEVSGDSRRVEDPIAVARDALRVADSRPLVGEMNIFTVDPRRAGTDVLRKLRERVYLGAGRN